MSSTLRWGTPAGQRLLETTFLFSLDGPPFVELLQWRPGSLWDKVGFHHIGAWSDDLAAESERFVSEGFEWRSAILNPSNEPVGGCVHTIVDDAPLRTTVSRPITLPRFDRYLTGGEWGFPQQP